tara:strand:+ start:2923 stop:3357 length:435 start_codon:yes stop_codon:yes gene_type:complete
VRISHPLALVGLVVLAACASQLPDPAPPVEPEPAKPAPEIAKPVEQPPVPVHQAEINASALTPYSEDQSPELVSRFSARLGEVELFRQLAAKAAAANPDCQMISLVEVASTSTPDDLRFWVECSDNNGDPVRYNFTEAELKPQG